MTNGKRTLVERPEDYSDDQWVAYKAGAAAMANYMTQITASVAAAASDPKARAEEARRFAESAGDEHEADAEPVENEDASETERRADEKSSCNDCGGDVLFEMGSDVGRCRECGADVHHKTD